MPRLNVIVLDQHADDLNTYNVVLWADVPAARQSRYADANAKSVWSGATAADNTNLQTGVMVESTFSQRIPAGTTLPQIEAFLQTAWQNFQDRINNTNLWQRYGSTWDGTTWTVLNNG
jgi:hypothetical protein